MRFSLSVAVLCLLAGACGGVDGDGAADVDQEHRHEVGSGGDDAGAAPAFAVGEATTAVDVTLQDYAFVGLPATVAGPKVFFRAALRGGNTHEFEILDGAGVAIDEIAAFRGAGSSRELAVVLPPGTYTAQCLVEEGVKTHADLGMKQTFTVT